MDAEPHALPRSRQQLESSLLHARGGKLDADMAAVRMYEEDFATREDTLIAGMRLGCGHPTGPLTLCDFIRLDVLYAVCTSLYEVFKRDEYAPPPLMKRMVAAGRLAPKSGSGFYEYEFSPRAVRT